MRVPCVVLAFHDLDMIRRSIESLLPLGERLDLTIVENPSEHSKAIKTYLSGLLQAGKIGKHILFETNIAGNAYADAIEAGEVSLADSLFVILTDGDLVPASQSWFDETIGVLERHPEVFCCAVTLDTGNLPLAAFPDAGTWIPTPLATHDDYVEALTGCHLLAMRVADLKAFLDHRRSNRLAFVDKAMHEFCYSARKMRWARTKLASARHLAWDRYADRQHPYTQLKLSRSHADTWHRELHARFAVFRRGSTEVGAATSLRLHVGCGETLFDGWVNIDLDSPKADLKHDLRQPLPYADDSVEFIYNEHFMEHLTVQEGVAFLRECYRLLKPGGVLRIATPDLAYIVRKYFWRWKDQVWITKYGYEGLQTRAEMLNLVFREWGHKYLYDAEELERRLREAGFTGIARRKLNRSPHAPLANRETREDSRLVLEATKR